MNDTPQFDLIVARELAAFCHRAYVNGATGEVVYDASTETRCLVAELADVGKFTCIAFRGTADVRNWLTDLEFPKIPLAHGVRVHHGFIKSTDAILPLLQAKLGHPADSPPLIITGHSLGGALAALAAFELQRAGYNVESVYTFASPRVGNAGWRDMYNQLLRDRTFRVAAVGDLVPLVPGIYTTFRDGYRHVGTEVLLSGSELLLEPSHLIEMIKDGWAAYWAFRSADWDFILKKHSITGDYLASLESIITATGIQATELRKG